MNRQDVIVVGAGHAGIEAALASARMGQQTLLLTQSLDTIGALSCNPAVGGLGKSHLVAEIDALGGVIAQAADASSIQSRVLNRSKGPAVRATRAQVDRVLYRAAIYRQINAQDNLQLLQQNCDDLIVESGRVYGVITQAGISIRSKTVILATGTFLGGLIHIGDKQVSGGRSGDPASSALAKRLRELLPEVGRLKTGTPPRLDHRTIQYDSMTVQQGETPTPRLSSIQWPIDYPEQLSCYLTYTNEQTHSIVRSSLALSAVYSGAVEGVGPRYCPSIEDKVVRFSERTRHQVFVEPEGLTTSEVYLNGLSTSLPAAVQIDFIRSIAGFEQAHITRFGYAIEYDYFNPQCLRSTLETKTLDNLYFAGQINGTTGYEEAAAQGLLAGINAALRVQEKPAWVPQRSESYIGVLVDDLVTNGTEEPYRMFTSRAEYRLSLREDNADERLTAIGRSFGLISEHRWQSFCEKKASIESEQQRLASHFIKVGTPEAKLLEPYKISVHSRYSLFDILKRSQITYRDLMRIYPDVAPDLSDDVIEQIEIAAKYAGYIARQATEIKQLKRFETTRLPEDFDYSVISGLSNEIVQKLTRVRPETLGSAARISGMTPAALSQLLIHLKSKTTQKLSAHG